MKYILVTLFGLTLVATQGQAQSYGMAGCGLGSIVAKEMNWKDDIMQVLAATTNGTTGSQTFGISFGTSNCGENLVDRRKAEREVFLEYNYANLKKDAAMGDGPYLEALGQLLGCSAEQISNFKAYSQEHFVNIYQNLASVLPKYELAISSKELGCAS